MKQSEMIILGVAAAALFVVTKAKAAGKPAVQVAKDAVTEILNAGQAFGNGWRYFSDGTAIGPDGKYYKNGALIWSPTKNTGGASGSWEPAALKSFADQYGSSTVQADDDGVFSFMLAEPDAWGRIPGTMST